MASKSLWAIVDFLRENQTITPRQVQNLLGCDCKKSHNLLLHLTRKAVVIRTGEPLYKAVPLYTVKPAPVSPVEVEIECDICGFKSTALDCAHYCCEDNSDD
ncbi:hypothetical protein [Citrobacter koseri]|uniref:hypothetical protein n=1 Tax=Citrobacter koseri TaxID=545 RepID=UPI001903FD4A|nr:hypothetical protein [Citrobacter koseri]MBJ8865287.1 hypothetical protein [Citrobacter koseri]MBL4565034.1 hypothetical protein [Citrobacter koseri]